MTEQRLTIVEHLQELRKRIIISLITLVTCGIFSFPFAKDILEILKKPASGLIEKLVFFSPQDAFSAYVRIAIFSGLFFSMPVILYELWAFLAPTVGPNLKRFAFSFVFFVLAVFILGCVFAYFVILPLALKFLLEFAKGELVPLIQVDKYISFVIWIILGCGLIFQMPVLSFILTKINIINPKFLIRKFKYAILVIFIIAALITPTTDVFNMCVLAIPMLFLYALSIGVSTIAQKRC